MSRQRDHDWIVFLSIDPRDGKEQFLLHPRGDMTPVISDAYGYHYKDEALAESLVWFKKGLATRVQRRSTFRKASDSPELVEVTARRPKRRVVKTRVKDRR